MWRGIDRVLAPVSDKETAPDPSAWLAAVSSIDALAAMPASGPAPPEYSGCRRIICDPGSLAASSSPEASLANWGPRARAALHAACAAIAPGLLSSNLSLFLRPRIGHVLSDVPSSLAFLRASPDGPFGLLLEPTALLDVSMIPRAEEHLSRILDALLTHDRVCGVVVANLVLDRDRPAPSPIHRGLLDKGLLVSAARAAESAGLPVVLYDDELTDQVSLLGSAGIGN